MAPCTRKHLSQRPQQHEIEKTESETHRKKDIEKMLREDDLVAQALQDIERAESEERHTAACTPRKST